MRLVLALALLGTVTSTAHAQTLENGRTATVRVQDRGPYAPSRVMDVTPRVAEKLARG